MTLPIDRTKKTTLDANLQAGITSNAQALKDNNDVVYDTIDELNTKADGIASVRYTKDELNNGQLNNLYYTETEIDSPARDHKGTWQGLTPGQASEAINGGRLDILEPKMDAAEGSVKFQTAKRYSLVEQYVSSFYGRGQLVSEKVTENTTTETSITVARPAGYGGIEIVDTTNFKEGSIIVIKYDDGTYATHFVRAVTNTTTLSILPPTIKDITTNTKVERCWYNSAHPGKFYMRYLAQRLANEMEDQGGYGESVFYANFDGSSNDDAGVALGGATIGYNNAINKGSNYGTVLECAVGKVAYFTTDVVGGGIKLPEFAATKGERLVLRLFAMSRNAANTTRIAVKTPSGTIVDSMDIIGAASQIMKPRTLDFIVPYDADRLHVEVTNQSSGLVANYVFIDEVRVMRDVRKSSYILPKIGKILGLGDSWVAGDTTSTLERESFLTHLATLLPDAEIINKGVGGNKVQDLLARFDTDVVPNSPDVVIINTGTNDAYNPASATFDPNAIDYFEGKLRELVQRCIDIGAKPVVIAPPALAEEDGTALNFLLNDRSRDYNKRIYPNYFKANYGNPTVQNTGANRYGKLDQNGTYLAGNNYKDVKITIGTDAVKVRRITIPARAFDATTSANVTLKIYDATRATLLATSDTLTIIKDAAIQPFEFTLPDILTLAASTSYILAFEGSTFWSVHEGGAGTTKNYGKFTVDNIVVGNTTPPSTTLNKWIGVLLIPPIGTQKVFVDSVPGRYTLSPTLSDIDKDSTVSVLDDKNRVLTTFRAKLGEEFSFKQ
jgi:lysophospholipase L1-like esterase